MKAADALAILMAPQLGDAVPVSALGGAHTLTPAEERIVRRSIAGEGDDETARLPSLAGFIAAAAASGDWGVPVRSSSSPDRFGKGAMRGGGGGRPHDPNLGREQYALAERELRRIGDELPAAYGLDGSEQMAVWCTISGAGRLELRNIHAGGRPDAIEREERRASGRAMKPPGKRRVALVPERHRMTASAVALWLREHDVFLTPHQVGLICRRINGVVAERFAGKGWTRPQAERREREMAASDYVNGWKEIAVHLGVSVRRAQQLEERGLPVRHGLSTAVCALKSELDAWSESQRKLRSTVLKDAG